MQSISVNPSAEDLALQDRMRKHQGLVADRLFHLKTYPKCMVGSEMVDWLIADTSTGPYLERRTISREECIQRFQSLVDAKLLHHVKDEHQFEDAMLFYRFYADEAEIPSSARNACKQEAQHTAEALLEKQIREQPGLISNRKFHLVTYNNVMVGSEFVDWMMASSKTPLTRAQCVVKGQALINARMLHHVTDEHRFEDAMLFYKFYSDEPADFVPTTSLACLDNFDLTPTHMTEKTAATKPAKITVAPPEIPAYDPNNMHLYT
jgi:phosphatidylinositol 3,4,5-trisphosphate-dependent Rac exchanger 2 protein